MGNFEVIWDPKSWIILNQGESSKVNGDLIYQMMIGEGEDEHHLHFSFIEYISKNNYEKIINGTYTLKRFPYSDIKVLLFDENKKLVSLVLGTMVNSAFLDDKQKETISNMKNDLSLKRKKE